MNTTASHRTALTAAAKRPSRRVVIGLAIVVGAATDDGARLALVSATGLRVVLALGLSLAAWRIGVRVTRLIRRGWQRG